MKHLAITFIVLFIAPNLLAQELPSFAKLYHDNCSPGPRVDFPYIGGFDCMSRDGTKRFMLRRKAFRGYELVTSDLNYNELARKDLPFLTQLPWYKDVNVVRFGERTDGSMWLAYTAYSDDWHLPKVHRIVAFSMNSLDKPVLIDDLTSLFEAKVPAPALSNISMIEKYFGVAYIESKNSFAIFYTTEPLYGEAHGISISPTGVQQDFRIATNSLFQEGMTGPAFSESGHRFVVNSTRGLFVWDSIQGKGLFSYFSTQANTTVGYFTAQDGENLVRVSRKCIGWKCVSEEFIVDLSTGIKTPVP